MPVKTRWPITYARGHTAPDLSANKAYERGGFSNKECTECWRAKQGAASQRLSAEDWLAQRRTEDRAETQEWEQRAETWLLAGSEQAGDSGRRFAVLSAAYEAVVMNGDLATGAAGELERPARLIDRASGWELVEAAQATRAASSEDTY